MELYTIILSFLVLISVFIVLIFKCFNEGYTILTNKLQAFNYQDRQEETLNKIMEQHNIKLKRSIKKLNILSELSIIAQRLFIGFSKNYIAFSWVSFILFIIFIGILYIIFPNFFIIQGIVNYIGERFFDLLKIELNEENKNIIIKILEAGTNFITVFISVSLTLYFFTIRQRRTISLSNINVIIRNNSFSFFIILLCVVYGKLFLIFNKGTGLETFSEVSQYTRVAIWCLLFLLSVFNALSIVRYMLKSVNQGFLLKQNFGHINSTTKKLTYSFINKNSNLFIWKVTKKFKIIIINYLHDSIESHYQMLTVAINNNMGSLYDKNYNDWNSFLTDFMQGYNKGEISAAVPHEKLYAIDPESFCNYYKSIIRNQKELIMTLLDNNKLIDAEEAFKTLTTLEPSHLYEDLREIYLSNLHEILINIYLNHDIGFRYGIEGLEKYCNADTLKEKSSGLVVYQDLLLKAVERNDVNQISNLVYSMIKPLDRENAGMHSNKKLNKVLKFLNRYKNKDFMNKYLQSVVFIVLQSVLKSIELSKYNSTGFLIKFLITNFYSESKSRSLTFRNTFEYFTQSVQKEIDENPYIDKGSLKSRLTVSPNFNPSTRIYCLHKLALLCYGQQRFSDTMKMAWKATSTENSNREKINIASSLKDCIYIDYLFLKINRAKNKYGMIYLEDMQFMGELKEIVIFNLRKVN
jgi:hypothetical protein